MSIIALFAYEYLITLSREVDLFWKRKFTMASAPFIVNRYLVLAVNILDMPYSIIVGVSGLLLKFRSRAILSGLVVRRMELCKLDPGGSSIPPVGA